MAGLDYLLKYAPIVILYIFILRIAYTMVKDLNKKDLAKGFINKEKAFEQKDFKVKQPFFLYVIDSNEAGIPRGKEITLDNSLSIGRGGQNDVVISDGYISHEHARITQSVKGYLIEDLKSTNGVFVNDTRILKPTILERKDKIKIGGVTFQFMRWENEVQ